MLWGKRDIPPIHGFVAAGFEAVAAAFRDNFVERGDMGAACTIFYQGRKVVDLWGGYRDPDRSQPWEEKTLVLVFSATKGMSALCLALAHSRGWLDYDERVASYWPEFGQAGKESITVRQLLAHQAGLCAIDDPLDEEVLADLDALAAAAARQRPAWTPGTRVGYHAVSLGWYMGELLRRVDPEHRSLGRFFQEEIARPLDLEFYIGLPDEVPDARIAIIRPYRPTQLLLHINTLPWPFVKEMLSRNSLTARAFFNPNLSPSDYNRRAILRLEMPASNGVGQVRALARAYGECATGGRELNLRVATLDELMAPAAPPFPGAIDEVLRVEAAYALGFLKPSPHTRFGSDHTSYGASGAGGTFAFADPVAQVGYAYATNRVGFFLRNDPRERALQDALYRCL